MGIQDCEPATFEPTVPSLDISVGIAQNGVLLETESGVKVPGLMAAWVDPLNPYILAVEFSVVRSDAGPDASGATYVQPVDRKSWGTTENILPGSRYEVRYRARGLNDARGPWSSITTVTTPSQFTASDTTHVDGVPSLEITNRLQSVEAVASAAQQGVADLEAAYGPTVNASASAAAAAASEAAANQAKADAVIAQGAAQAARDVASTKASDAAGSAASALTSKNDSAASAATATTKAQDATNAAATATQQAGLAAGSATAAGGSATAAAGSASQATTKANEAGNSATAANASKVAAESARDASQGSATASAASAASAATSADAAGTSASAANTAKLAAETARAQAQTFRNEAADSATNAAGSAATASNAASQSVTARDQSQGFATAANTSAQNAAGSATAAGNSASAANTSKTAAEAVYGASLAAAIAGFPDVLASDLLTAQANGSPTTVPSLNAAWFSAAGITPGVGASGTAFYKQTVPWVSGKVYEFDYEVEGLTGASFATLFGQYLDAAFAATTARTLTYVATPNGVKTRIVQRIALDRTVAGATTWTLAGTGTDRLRFGVIFNRLNTGAPASGQARLTRMTVRDVTGLVDTQSVYDKTVILGGNQGFEDGLTGWGPLSAVPPGIFGVNGDGPTYQATYQGRRGVAVVSPGMGRRNIYSDKLFPIDTSRKFRLRTWVYVGSGGASRTYVGFRTLDASSVTVGSNGGHQYSAVGGILDPENTGWKEYVSGILTGEGAGGFNAGTKQIQLCAFLNYAGANGTSLVNTALDGIWIEDVTESEAAKAQATASATSAANAAASATLAGEKAIASQASATAADTSRAQAQTAASQASQSETNSAGSAASASSAAQNAATSRDQASGFATAASGSASTASTKANEAGNSAAAAAASQVSASAAKDAAVSAAIAGFPDVLASDLLTNVFSGAPATRPNLPANAFVNGAYTPAFSSAYAIFKQDVRWKDGAVYELTAGVEGLTNGTQAPHFRLLAASLREDYTDRGVYGISPVTQSPVGSTTRLVWRVSLGVTVPGATRLNRATEVERLRFGAHFNTTSANADNVGSRSTLKLLTIRDVTAQVAAESSATAAATSASSASASATTAGEKATAASGSAATAATKAGEASTFANQAASSASGAAGSAVSASQASGTAVTARDAAIGARNDAQAAAATAVAQSSSASASAASASISADLAARVGSLANMLPNSTATAGMSRWSPGQWFQGSYPGYGTFFQCTAPGQNDLVSENIPALPGETYTVSFYADAGGGTGEVYVAAFNGNTLIQDGMGRLSYVSGDWDVRRVCPSFVLPAGANAFRVVCRKTAASSYGSVSKIMVNRGPTAIMWNDFAQDVALEAQLRITASVAADAQTRLSTVRFDVTGGAGGDPFQIWARADASGSAAGIVATELSLSNVVGGAVVTALKLVGGRAVFAAPISIVQGGRRTTLGPGFGVGSNLHLWSGPDTVAYGAETYDNGILGLSDTDGYFGGKVSNGPFDSGTPSATSIGLSSGWTTVATVASKYLYNTGSFLFRADWQAILSPKAPPSEAPVYGLNWRVVSTNMSGGDLRIVTSGYVTAPVANANIAMGQPYTLIEGHVSQRGDRKLLLQLAMSGTDDVTAASTSNARLSGVYYQNQT